MPARAGPSPLWGAWARGAREAALLAERGSRSVGRCSAPGRTRTTAHRDDLYPAIVTFAVATGDHAFELGQGQVHHAPIARVHRFEGDNLAFFDGLTAEALGHSGQ